MTDSSADLVERAVRFVRRAQLQDGLGGGFMGLASSDAIDFTNSHAQPTIFFTALITATLAELTQTSKQAKTITDQARNFLLRHRSAQWSWNYWQRGSRAERAQPYPDDLDDTACAVAALSLAVPNHITGGSLGHLASLLIAAEAAPGGPYQTWLIDHEAQPAWADIDLAVNANIGYCLSLQSVTVPGLMAYIAQKLEAGALQSSYYIDDVPTIYFLARWYRGDDWQSLAAQVTAYLISGTYNSNPLFLAMLITSGCKLNVNRKLLKAAQQMLENLAVKDHWETAALYYEPLENGVQYYAGSSALTTAFAIQALISNCDEHQTQQLETRTKQLVRTPVKRHVSGTILAIKNQIPETDLRYYYGNFVSDVIKRDVNQQITGIATTTAQALAVAVKPNILEALNIASLNGWIAYTIYDDIWDDASNTRRKRPAPRQLLGVANVALRVTSEYFYRALPAAADFHELVKQTLTRVDIANTWEVRHARVKFKQNLILIKNLPNYANLGQLAERSCGHSLAASGTLYAAGYALNSPRQVALRLFFHHYLIARQLNDDAHDWQEDLSQGQLSAVATMLLRDYFGTSHGIKFVFESELEALRACFWRTTINDVAELVYEHLVAARLALVDCSFVNANEYERWLSDIEAATTKALTKRDEAQQFMRAFQR